MQLVEQGIKLQSVLSAAGLVQEQGNARSV